MSITREENGTYTSQVRVKDWTGKTIHKKKRGFKRKKDAKEWERQMLSQGNILNTTLKDLEFPYFYAHSPAFTGSAINNFQKMPKI